MDDLIALEGVGPPLIGVAERDLHPIGVDPYAPDLVGGAREVESHGGADLVGGDGLGVGVHVHVKSVSHLSTECNTFMQRKTPDPSPFGSEPGVSPINRCAWSP